MKTLNTYKILLISVFAMFLLVFASCGKGSPNSPIIEDPIVPELPSVKPPVMPEDTNTDIYVGDYKKLLEIQDNVNNGTDNYAGKTIHLAADIDVEGKAIFIGIGKGYINQNERPFKGTFDGAGYEIKNIAIDNTADGGQYVGFIANLGEGGVVKNLTVSGTIKGGSGATIGGIVGNADKNTKIENCVNKANIEAASGATFVGGIVGYIHDTGILDNVRNEGNISISAGGVHESGDIAGNRQ